MQAEESQTPKSADESKPKPTQSNSETKIVTKPKNKTLRKQLRRLYNTMLNNCKDYKGRFFFMDEDSEKIASVIAKNFSEIDDDETPLMMYDESLLKRGKEGFVLTTKNLYIKNSNDSLVIDLPSIKIIKAEPKLLLSFIAINDRKIPSTMLKKELIALGNFLQKAIPIAIQLTMKDETQTETAQDSEEMCEDDSSQGDVGMSEIPEEIENADSHDDSENMQNKEDSQANENIAEIDTLSNEGDEYEKLLKEAEQGNAEAQYNLAKFYLNNAET